MSTRCQIGIYDKRPTDVASDKWDALIYRHSDGYSGEPDGSEYGLLADLVPWMNWFAATRGLRDTEYAAARLLAYLARKMDDEMRKLHEEWDKDRPRTPSVWDVHETFGGVLGYGISTAFHGDIEYFYALSPEGVDVYRARCWNEPYEFTFVGRVAVGTTVWAERVAEAV